MDINNLRNFKDFLQLYNQMTEKCFTKCVDNTNARTLESNEISCVEKCANKFIKYNNKLMMYFVRTQNDIVNRRVKEAEELQKQKEAEEQLKHKEVEDQQKQTHEQDVVSAS